MGKVTDLKNRDPHLGKKVGITLAIVMLMVIGIYVFASKSHLFNIKTINISGNEKLTEDRVALYSGIAVGDNLVELDEDEVLLNLKSEPYIDRVEVVKKLPNAVEIKIVEKKDVLVVDGEKKIYLDSRGEILSTGKEFKNYSVPLLQGLKVKSSVISKEIEYENDIDRDEFASFMKGISELTEYRELKMARIAEDGAADLYFGENQIVKFGKIEDTVYKFNYLEEIVADLKSKDKVYEKIDFTRGNRVIVEEKLVREEE